MMDFTGKRVLVTGGSRGIGRAIAAAFAQGGARVAISYRSSRAAAEETLSGLPGGPHIVVRADVTDPAAVERMVGAVITGLGGLDVVVNNAGIWMDHRLDEIDYEQWQDAWRRVLDANLIGPANVSYCAARHMIEHGGGRIVNVSSRGAFRGEPDGPAYGASKAGLNAMSQSLAKLLAPHGIFVGAVAPGWVETDMAADALDGPQGDEIRGQSPLGRVARPEEVARAVLFLAADGSEFCTGAIIDVNGASYLRT
ncbi:MAG TPA: SDR family oxidoreductase [Thermoanaerobaculales bacterium]|nr:SDR family oxidoreductase [Thermoanaerobaculales bacterium]HPA80262.1 SDR family oxidoreductase [Thermoanaerobaculales bacterium]HQL29829.1 SDR family oxidoreductase [Thermoanaerobaculales bacterium]HQN95505.1 SDR family oxidoreductase [Thermoanaerobaculales bacterium]HQP44533.1 SDR family oxidoreductase [Thermoanaerobaculales bacterium]